MSRILTKYSTAAAMTLFSVVASAQPPGVGPGGRPPGFAPPQMGSERGGPPRSSFGGPGAQYAPPQGGPFSSPVQQGSYPGMGRSSSGSPGSSGSKRPPTSFGPSGPSGYPGQQYPPGSAPSDKSRSGSPYSGSRQAPPGYYLPSSPMPGEASHGYAPQTSPYGTRQSQTPGGSKAGKRNGSGSAAPSWKPASRTPTGETTVQPAHGGYTAPGQGPSHLQKQMKTSSNALRAAMAQGDGQEIGTHLSGIREEAAALRGRLHGLPLEQRLHVPSIALMYDEGTRLVEEGLQSTQDSKVQMGLEKIEDANRKLGELQRR